MKFYLRSLFWLFQTYEVYADVPRILLFHESQLRHNRIEDCKERLVVEMERHFVEEITRGSTLIPSRI